MTFDVRGVSKRFGAQRVLRDVSIGVDAGEILTIVGPSGTGKSTLLRLFALFHPPDEGTVSWHGDDVWASSDEERLAVRRRLSMVFQEPSLFNASVARNVTYGTRIRSTWRDRIRTQVRAVLAEEPIPDSARDALQTVGLFDELDRNALSLSGGEAQRVAFARALAVDPAVLLLDEPTSNLDPRNTAVLEDTILRARDRGVGVVVATHDMHQAERISDRVGFLYEGELIETGPPAQLFEDPNDPRTRAFVDGELLYDAESPVDRTGPTPG